MKTDIHAIIEMLNTDPMGISVKFGIPLRTVYSWCKGNRKPADYVLCMMLTIILLERRLGNGNSEERLEERMGSCEQGIQEAGQKS